MKVYLLYIDGRRRPVFHADDPEDATPRDPRGRPIRTPLERRWRGLKATIKRALHRGGPRVQRVWRRLNRRSPPDEPLLQGLRNARRVTVFHPSTMRGTSARRLWARYLGRRWRSHLVTLAWDLALGPVIILVSVMPGPNIIGYWFLYRIVTHLLSMRGVHRARSGRVSLEFRPAEPLDRPIPLDDSARIDHVSDALGLTDLDDFLRRLAVYWDERAARTRAEPGRKAAGPGQIPDPRPASGAGGSSRRADDDPPGGLY